MKRIPAILVALLLTCHASALAGSFLVTSSSDSPDAMPGDGMCMATDLSGCSLRAALDEANAAPGPDTIVISAGVDQVSVTAGALLFLDNATLIRGENNETAIDGLLNVGGDPLFLLSGDSCLLAGLTLKRSRTDAVLITGAHNRIGGQSDSDAVVCIQNGLDQVVSAGIRVSGTRAMGNVIRGCYVGTTVAGPPGLANQHGIIVEQQASSTMIDGCLVSGNTGWGVIFQTGAQTNTVVNCSVGLDGSGFYALPNGAGGVLVSSGAIDNTIGSLSSFPANVIAGNEGDGIRISGVGTSGNAVIGSVIGLDVTALTSLGNSGAGIRLAEGSRGNVIGGVEPEARNLIGGNWLDGIRIENPGTGQNRVIGNWIGIAANAFRARSNGLVDGNGVTLRDRASDNDVGGHLPGERNVISGEQRHAILITGNGTSQNRIRGNFIGVNPAGQFSFYNGSGVVLRAGASHNTIGGDSPAERNVISGSANEEYPFGGGVMLYDDGTSYNTVQGNYIGLDAEGGRLSPNATAGVVIGNGASFNMIGGDTPGTGNVISGNGYGTLMLGLGRGVHIEGTGTRGNTISGNFIGTVAGGSAGIRNFGHGIAIVGGASENTIGGTAATAGNTIAYNRYHGIFINDVGTEGNSVRYNSLFRNDSTGVVIAGGAQDFLSPPVISAAGHDVISFIRGTAAVTNGVVDIYQAAPDQFAAGEPKTLLGSTSVNAEGEWSVSGLDFAVGDTLTAVVTDASGNSSGCAENAVVSFLSAIEDDDPLSLPMTLALEQNYPNPFNPITKIEFSLPVASEIAVSVFNVAGQRVAVLVDGRYPAGDHRVRWNATDDAGQAVASGVYFYRLETEAGTLARKMLLLK